MPGACDDPPACGWTRVLGQRTLTDTERFVETVAPLATDEAIIEAVAETVTNALTTNVNLEAEVKGFLPPIAAPLAGPISSAIPTFVKQVTLKILNSPQFQQFWTRAAGSLQSAVIKALEGESTGPVSTSNGQVVLDTGDVIDQVKKVLASKGLTAIADRPTPPAADREIVLLNSDQLAQAQSIYKLTKPAATWLIVIVLLLFVGAIALRDAERGWLRTSGSEFSSALESCALAWRSLPTSSQTHSSAPRSRPRPSCSSTPSRPTC